MATTPTNRQNFEEFCRTTFSPKTEFSKPEALKGMRVLSCTQYILGPSCASYFAELGAEVIKIEAPRRGEAMRHTTPFNEPFLYPLSRWVPERGTGLGFIGANPNEYFLSLDFHRPEAQAIMRKLAAKSDIMVENYRPGTFDRWGIGYRQMKEVNPRLIYVWLGGFGGWGPGRVRASYDILGQSQGGNFGVTGKPEFQGGAPAKHTIWLADYWGGMMGFTAALAALHHRNKTGQGTFIEYSQVHGVTRQLEYALPIHGKLGVCRERWGNMDTQLCVHGIVKCGKSSYPNSENPQEQEEGYILVSAYSDADFAKLCKVMGDGDMAKKYAKATDRIQPNAQLAIYEWIEKWTADKTKEQAAAILDSAGINNQPVWNSKEVSNHPHWQERGSVRWVDDPTYGPILHQGPAFKLSHTPPRVKWACKPIGADNEYILGKLMGFSPEEIKRLEEQECI